MKVRALTRILGVILPAALVITSPVFAHDPYNGRHVDHDYSYGGHVDHEYNNGRHLDHDYSYGGHIDHDYSYGGHVDHEYRGRPYYGDGSYYGYEHPSGALGYWGKDARHHERGHHHHHWF